MAGRDQSAYIPVNAGNSGLETNELDIDIDGDFFGDVEDKKPEPPKEEPKKDPAASIKEEPPKSPKKEAPKEEPKKVEKSSSSTKNEEEGKSPTLSDGSKIQQTRTPRDQSAYIPIDTGAIGAGGAEKNELEIDLDEDFFGDLEDKKSEPPKEDLKEDPAASIKEEPPKSPKKEAPKEEPKKVEKSSSSTKNEEEGKSPTLSDGSKIQQTRTPRDQSAYIPIDTGAIGAGGAEKNELEIDLDEDFFGDLEDKKSEPPKEDLKEDSPKSPKKEAPKEEKSSWSTKNEEGKSPGHHGSK